MELPLNPDNNEQFKYINSLLYGDGPLPVPEIDEVFYINKMKINFPYNATYTFAERYNNGEINCPYKYEDYINDEDIQATVQGLGMEPDAFWLLVIFCFDFSYIACRNGFKTVIPQMEIEKLIKIMPDDKLSEMELTIKTEKGSETIKDSLTIWHILNCLKEKFGDNIGKENKHYPISPEDARYILHDYKESDSVLLWYFATFLNDFFRLNPKFRAKRKKGENVSYNKRLLISRLIYYTHISRNKSFLYSPETLNGYFKQYKNKPIRKNSLTLYD